MRHHILQELGFTVRRAGDELHGAVEVTPFTHVPGTPHLRTAVLASLADLLSGLLAAQAMGPRVPVTLELDVHLYRPAPTEGMIRAVGRPVKKGRSVFVGSVEFTTERGEPIGFSASSFMAAPDTTLRMPRRRCSPWRPGKRSARSRCATCRRSAWARPSPPPR